MTDIMRVSKAAIAFATLYSDTRFILRWSHEWRQWNLIGGHQRDGETPFACMSRKIASELVMSPKRVFVAKTPLFTMRYESASLRTGKQTLYEVVVFGATVRARKIPLVTDGQANNLVSEDEVVSGIGPGGTLVSEMTLRAVDKLRELRAVVGRVEREAVMP